MLSPPGVAGRPLIPAIPLALSGRGAPRRTPHLWLIPHPHRHQCTHPGLFSLWCGPGSPQPVKLGIRPGFRWVWGVGEGTREAGAALGGVPNRMSCELLGGQSPELLTPARYISGVKGRKAQTVAVQDGRISDDRSRCKPSRTNRDFTSFEHLHCDLQRPAGRL